MTEHWEISETITGKKFLTLNFKNGNRKLFAVVYDRSKDSMTVLVAISVSDGKITDEWDQIGNFIMTINCANSADRRYSCSSADSMIAKELISRNVPSALDELELLVKLESL